MGSLDRLTSRKHLNDHLLRNLSWLLIMIVTAHAWIRCMTMFAYERWLGFERCPVMDDFLYKSYIIMSYVRTSLFKLHSILKGAISSLLCHSMYVMSVLLKNIPSSPKKANFSAILLYYSSECNLFWLIPVGQFIERNFKVFKTRPQLCDMLTTPPFGYSNPLS